MSSEEPSITNSTPETPSQTTPAEDVTFRFVAHPPESNVPYQAPELPPHFVSRVELVAIKKLLLTRPNTSLAPITMHGTSGTGKTALATALAHDVEVLAAFPDGVLWISLGENADSQHAQALWGSELGNNLSHLPDVAGRASALRAILNDLQCLLILDDVTDIEQVKALNVGGPNCARLITTDKADEITYALKTRRYSVGKMSEEESLSLITEWAGILPDIYLPTVREIIKRLGHRALPLALVGAQARQGITWLRLLEVLRDDQGPISSLNPDDPETQKNALGLIVNLVLSRFGGAQLQRSALLGVFAAGMGAPFSIGAASACWDVPPTEASSILSMLVEAALVQRLPGEYYSLHQALRDHLRQSATPVALAEASSRVKDYYITLVEQAGAASAEIDNQIGQVMGVFKQVSERGTETANQFADALIAYFEQRGLWANLITLAKLVTESAQQSHNPAREHSARSDLGYAYTVLGDLDEARSSFERSLEISKSLGDPNGEAIALNNIGAICEREGKYLEAQGYYERSLAIRELLGERTEIANALNNIAGAMYWQQRWDEALNTFQRVLDMYTVINDRLGQAQTELNIGAVHENIGKDQEALQAYHRSLAIYANLGEEGGQSQALNNLGIVYLNQGDTERALAHFKRSLSLKERLGDRHGQAATLNNIALLYEKTGALTLALDYYGQSYKILDMLEDPRAEVVQENIDKLKEEMSNN
ncbi:MAG: tetratricopeptide repeat protein [Anaerolineae bacterium]|nr:tetratricopeptide repeat protein [Anaerolineae bacterium]